MLILLALIPFVTWALGDIYGALSSRRVGNIPSVLGFLVCSFLLLSLGLPFMGFPSSWPFLLLALFLGGIHVAGLMMYFQALEVGNASLAGSIVGSFSVVIVLLSLVVFRDALNLFQALGVCLAIAGLLLTSFQFSGFKNFSAKKLISDPGVVFALITLFAWGIYFTFIRLPVEKIGWYWSLYPATFYVFPILLWAKRQHKLTNVRFDKKALGQILLMAVFGRTGDLTYNMALTHGASSIVGAIAGASPILFVLLARFIFKEKLTLQQKIGIVSSMGGIVVIALGSS